MSDEEITALYHSAGEVIPVDLAAERETVGCILDYLATAPTIEVAMRHPLDQFGTITPWVSWQLGCVAEFEATKGQLAKALLSAYVSVNAALRCRDPQRLLGNLLTLAGIYLRARVTDVAEQVYLQILDLPIESGFVERAGAHLSLSSILGAGRPREAVDHFEQGLCCLGERLSPETRSKLVRGASGAYRELKDWIGLSYVCKVLNLGDVETTLREAVQSDLGLPQIVAADTRLRQLGAGELADQLYSMWSEAHFPGESS
jgi:hypothetical protein